MAAILIVEDEILTSEYLEFVLESAGYEVIPAASADEALAVLVDEAANRCLCRLASRRLKQLYERFEEGAVRHRVEIMATVMSVSNFPQV